LILILSYLTPIFSLYSGNITCSNNGVCTNSQDNLYSYTCTGNGACNCGNALYCYCNDNNGICNCEQSKFCSCSGNNGKCNGPSTAIANSGGAIAGIAIGSLIVVGIVIALCVRCCCCRNRYVYRSPPIVMVGNQKMPQQQFAPQYLPNGNQGNDLIQYSTPAAPIAPPAYSGVRASEPPKYDQYALMAQDRPFETNANAPPEIRSPNPNLPAYPGMTKP
jgi:hypothetical protein